MGFLDIVKSHRIDTVEAFAASVTGHQVLAVLEKNQLTKEDFLMLLSPAASQHLELMAQKANAATLKHFGRAVLLYTPIYIANHCSNKCIYCSFSLDNDIERVQLTSDAIRREAETISNEGFQHILLLTGEHRGKTPVTYIVEAIRILREYFEAVSIEIYPLTMDEYRQVVEAGVSGLTIYQETYDQNRYSALHLLGPKRQFDYRLDAPERGAEAGMRFINIGALLGLTHGVYDAFMSGLHADYLQSMYPAVEYGLSLPRMRPHIGDFQDFTPVSDAFFVQVLLAYRLFLPSMAINISTRESSGLREKLIPLGATNLSAGVSTKVGGHDSSTDESAAQFEIADERSLAEMCSAIKAIGYQPILKNWSSDFN